MLHQPILEDITVLLAVAEDERREEMARGLSDVAAELHTVKNGQEGLYAFARHRPDVVVVQADMPVMSGTAMARAVREINPDAVLIMALEPDDPQGMAEAFALRAEAYMFLPFSARDLLRVLAQCVGDIRRNRGREQQKVLTGMMLDGLPNPALLVDRKSRSIILANRRARRLGLAGSDALNEAFFPPDALGADDGGAFEGVAPYAPRQLEAVETLGRIWDVTLIPVSRRSVLCFAVDITERVRMARRLADSESRYRAIVEDQTEFIYRFLPDGTTTFVNRALARWLGMDQVRLVGRSFFSDLPLGDRELAVEAMNEMTPASPVRHVEFRVEPEGREPRWTQWIQRGIFDQAAQLVEVQAVGRDITETRQAREALAQVTREKERYRLNLEAIFQSIPDAILTVDRDMRVIETNKSMEGLCALGGEIRAGCRLADLHGARDCICREILADTLSTRQAIKERRIQCTSASCPGQILVLNSAPLLDRQGRFSGAVLVMRDITRLAELERTLLERSHFRNIVGKSEPMTQLYTLLEHLSDVDSTVLVTGESGTGKELVVEALHYGGSRSKGPLVKVNCSALSESLLESELFGHVRGAFTGAVSDKAGRFQAAEGGTVFLDEIGDISLGVQVKLLRFLESREFERVGDTHTLKADVRVLAATNADLLDKVRRGLFREDLFYRLKVMVIQLPPLRDRREDVPLLAGHFLHRFAREMGRDIDGFSGEVLRMFMTHAWPGNVRELKHAVEHACILCPGGAILPEHLPSDLTGMRNGFMVSADNLRNESSAPARGLASGREDILAALERTGWNKSRAARLLGVSRCTLYRRLAALGISGNPSN